MTEKDVVKLAEKAIGDWKFGKQWVESYKAFLYRFAIAAIEHEKRRVAREERKCAK